MIDDEAWFEMLFRENYDAVLRFALARADAATAKDATADAFLVAWRRRHEIPTQPLPWLLGVTRRTLADQRRAARRQGDLGARLAESALPSSSLDPGDEAAERLVVLRALDALAPGDQEVLKLVAWDGLSSIDAAAVLGCSRRALAVRLLRARRRLVAALAREDAVTLHPKVPSRETT